MLETKFRVRLRLPKVCGVSCLKQLLILYVLPTFERNTKVRYLKLVVTALEPVNMCC